MKARVYEVGHNELEDRAIRRMFTNIAPDAVVFICQRSGVGHTRCCICAHAVSVLREVDAQVVFYLCEPCLDNAMMRLRLAAKSRKAAFDV